MIAGFRIRMQGPELWGGGLPERLEHLDLGSCFGSCEDNLEFRRVLKLPNTSEQAPNEDTCTTQNENCNKPIERKRWPCKGMSRRSHTRCSMRSWSKASQNPRRARRLIQIRHLQLELGLRILGLRI